MVRFVNMRELKNRASAVVRQARRGDIIVTSHGKPKVVLHAIGGDDLEDYLLAHSPRFLKSVQASYSEHQKKGGISLAKVLAKAERELGKLQR